MSRNRKKSLQKCDSVLAIVIRLRVRNANSKTDEGVQIDIIHSCG